MIRIIRSRFVLGAILMALLGMLVAGGRAARADTQPPNPAPPAATPGPQPSPPLPAPTNIKQSWDGIKNAMTISWDAIPDPQSSSKQFVSIYYLCTDVSAGSVCDQEGHQEPLNSGNQFAEGTFVAFSDPAAPSLTFQPPDKATHFTMLGMNSTDYYVWQLCPVFKLSDGSTTRPCSPNIVLNNGLHMPEDGDCTNCPGFWTTPGPNGCNHEDLLDYYVWRWAYPGDKVCVDPSRLTQVLADNAQASARVVPGGGAYGPNTCISGYVWRVAKPDDLVCVTPAERDRVAAENANPNPTNQ